MRVLGACVSAAYIVFGKPEKGLTRDEFQEMIFRLGMVVTPQQMDVIMDHFDTDSASVSSQERRPRPVHNACLCVRVCSPPPGVQRTAC